MSGVAPVPVIMDVDTGVDDAMALAMAVNSDQIDLVGVTTVAGNVDRELATANTLRVLDKLGAQAVPVYRGMSRPLARAHNDATHFHGADGLGGAEFPPSTRDAESTTAVEFIVQSARHFAGILNLVFVGPLTNLATALSLEPALPDLIQRTVIMGGAFDRPGNHTPTAEFNIFVDPEAARAVAESDLTATWVGLDVTHSAEIYRADWDRLHGCNGPTAEIVREVCRMSFMERQLPSVYLHDPLALGVLLEPSVVSCERSAVWVDTSNRETAGMTRIVRDSNAPKHDVALQLDQDRFRRLFFETLDLPLDR